MKRILLIGITALLASCEKDPVVSEKNETLLSHEVEYRISKEEDYTEPIFDQSKAYLNLTISVENMQNGNNRVIWDTVLSLRPLRDYPPQSVPLVLRKKVETMASGDEILRLSQNIRYEDRDNLVYHISKGETLPRNLPFISVEIGL